MITSAAEFVALRASEDALESQRAAEDGASLDVWLEVVEAYPAMRRWVAHNKTVPTEVLELLAKDPDPMVRWAVALKRKIPKVLIEQLARDPDEMVRLRIAWHRRVAIDTLRDLAQDESCAVRVAAQRALDSRC